MNVKGMLPFENMVSNYLYQAENKNNHVLYRVTPIFEGDNLVCSGVQMEAKSVEDNGEGIKFNVFCYNVQPGITIDYKTGESDGPELNEEETVYILNKNSMKFHRPKCDSVHEISEKNKEEYTGGRQELINNGYTPCQSCKP